VSASFSANCVLKTSRYGDGLTLLLPGYSFQDNISKEKTRNNMTKSEQEYRRAISVRLNCQDDEIFFYWKGRVSLYALLRSMVVAAGDEVIVQGYTCVVVPNAILYLGATPVYVDIDTNTYNINIDGLKEKVNDKTKVIICQNTYGLSSNLEVISEIAREAALKYGHDVYTIEDCTHGFGGSYHGKPNGISCDASFFSTQWSKPYTTGIGGFCVVHNDKLKYELNALESEKITPSFKENFQLRLMYFVREYIVNDWTYWTMIHLYRWLSRKNIVVGSSSGEEVESIQMPNDFFKGQSETQYKKGIKTLGKLDSVNELRKKNAQRYTEYLMGIGKNHVDKSLFDDHVFVRYPLLVNNRKQFREAAEKANVVLGEWFEAPIYPAYNSLELWKLDAKDLPNALYICERIVNLPTDEKSVDKVIEFLERHKEDIVPNEEV